MVRRSLRSPVPSAVHGLAQSRLHDRVQPPRRGLVRGALRALAQGSRGILVTALAGAIVVACSGANGTEAKTTAAPANDTAAAPAGEAGPAPSGASQSAPVTAFFDSGRAWSDLKRQVAFGPRPSGSKALDDCRKWIVSQLDAAGITVRQQMFIPTTPIGEISMMNLIGTIPGRRPERIVLASHYDTKRSPNFRFVGASDGASSTAALLELGRALKQRQNEYTIELLFLDGEEAVNWEWQDPDNTYGSRYYVQAAQQGNALAGIKAFILLDMIGDKALDIRRDANSTPWLVDAVWDAAGRLGHRDVFSNDLTAIEDDHIPFVRAGVPSVDIIDLDYPQWHTAQDDLEHVSEQSLKVVGDVVLAAIPDIEARLRQP